MQRQKTNSKNSKGHTNGVSFFILYIVLVFCAIMSYNGRYEENLTENGV